MSDRSLGSLLPKVKAAAEAAIEELETLGVKVLVTCTYRSGEEQAELYAQGRTKPGKKVTNAKPGQSFHQYRVALDLYPMIGGKPDFSGNAPEWKVIARVFKAHGFEWAGEWKTFREMPHFQMTEGHPLAYFQAGGKI